MFHRFRVSTPVLMAGTAVLVFGVLMVLTAARPAQSSELPQRCARLTQESAHRATTVTGSGAKVVVIGDSYSAGSGLVDPVAAWPADLPGQVHVFGFPGSGFSRDASECVGAAYYERAVAALKNEPDALVVVEGGLNDFNQSDQAIRSGFRRLVALIGQRRVLVVGPTLAPSRAQGAVHTDRVLEAIARRTSTPYLSMLGHRFSFLPDRLHLTVAGHREFGAVVAARLRRL